MKWIWLELWLWRALSLETELEEDMATTVLQSPLGAALASCSRAQTDSSRASRRACHISYYCKNARSVQPTGIVHNLTGSPRVEITDGTLRGRAFNGRGSQIVAHGRSGRSALYGDAETYVFMEPGEDEQFVTAEELAEKLKKWLQEWPGEELPIDLAKFNDVDEAVEFLVNAVCELDLGDGQGSLQWYEVRLD